MDTKTYNGYTNYETWAVNLWLDNDQGTYNMVREWAEDAIKQSRHESRRAEGILADMLKDYIQEENPLASDASLFSDLLSVAISEVNFYEIAENALEGMQDEDEETEEVEEE